MTETWDPFVIIFEGLWLLDTLSVVMPTILEMSSFNSSCIFSSKASFKLSPVCSEFRPLQPKHQECISQDLVYVLHEMDMNVSAALLVHRSIVQAYSSSIIIIEML